MRDERRILLVADDDPRDALGARISVESVGLLFDVLALAGARALGHGFGEEGHEFADGGAGEAGVGGEVALGAEFDCGFGFVFEDLVSIVNRWRLRSEGCMMRLTPM